jgi:hypothetical protein
LPDRAFRLLCVACESARRRLLPEAVPRADFSAAPLVDDTVRKTRILAAVYTQHPQTHCDKRLDPDEPGWVSPTSRSFVELAQAHRSSHRPVAPGNDPPPQRCGHAVFDEPGERIPRALRCDRAADRRQPQGGADVAAAIVGHGIAGRCVDEKAARVIPAHDGGKRRVVREAALDLAKRAWEALQHGNLYAERLPHPSVGRWQARVDPNFAAFDCRIELCAGGPCPGIAPPHGCAFRVLSSACGGRLSDS